LGHSRNHTLGTTFENGLPHLSSITFAFRSSPEPQETAVEAIMWGDPASRHIKNLEHTAGRVAIHLARSDSKRNSLTLTGTASELEYGDEMPIMLSWLNVHRRSWRMPERSLTEFLPNVDAPRRLYYIAIDGATMPMSKLGAKGEWRMNSYQTIDLDELRGFERDPWRWQWFKHVAELSLRLFQRN
jgi:hypothetical protein